MRRTLIGLAFFLLLPLSLFAEAPVNIHFSIQTFDASLFDESIAVSACADSNTATTTTVNALCAVQQTATNKGWPVSLTWYSFGASLDGLSTYNADFANNRFWLYFVNGEPGSVALNAYHLSANDKLVLVYGIAPLKLSSNPSAISIGSSSSIDAEAFDFNAWAWQSAGATDFYINGGLSTSSSSGSFEFSPQQAGNYSIVGKKVGYISSEPITVAVTNAAASAAPTTAGGGCGACPQPPAAPVIKARFDTDKASAFLVGEQLPDGSFGSDLLNDWAALALGAKDSPAADVLSLYLVGHPTESTILTDLLRRAMALMALNLNPYMSDGNDYISRIKASFEDGQFGDKTFVNDDIFTIIVLRKAGVAKTDSRLMSAAEYVVAAQDDNGGWQSPDLTAAALQAFSLMPSTPSLVEARGKALEYLKATLFDDGGYTNAFTASWVTQGLVAEGLDSASWKKNGKSLADYLASMQQPDGGVKTDTGARDSRIWATAYAIPAALGLTIPDSLEEFESPNFQTESPASVRYEAAEKNNRTVAAVAALYLSGESRTNGTSPKPVLKGIAVNAVVPFNDPSKNDEEISAVPNVASVSQSKIRMGLWSWLVFQLGSFAKVVGEVF